MSLVLEALRRVEKTDEKTGGIGATVASSESVRRGRGVFPLLLGMATGGIAVAFCGPHFKSSAPPETVAPGHAPGGSAALPQPVFPLPPKPRTVVPSRKDTSQLEQKQVAPTAPSLGTSLLGARQVPPSLNLQAIGQRDSYPIAVINEQFVKEGDLVGTARVSKIGSDSVELVLANGTRETVRFAPLPPEPSPTPDRL